MARRRRRKNKNLFTLKRLAIALVGIALIWMYGLVLFINSIPRTIENQMTQTEAIVILTGGSERINSAIQLLNEGIAERLLISGAGEGANLENVLIVSGPLPDNITTLLDKIELGYKAQDTEGNAKETAEWVMKNNVKSIRLVTANYHVPRSMVLFKQYISNITIIPHPVIVEGVKLNEWWKFSGTKKLLISEYNKYLASYVRSIL